jgi:hypothetical protein
VFYRQEPREAKPFTRFINCGAFIFSIQAANAGVGPRQRSVSTS